MAMSWFAWVALLLLPAAADVKKPGNCTLERIEQLDGILSDAACTGIVLEQDWFLGGWLANTTHVEIKGNKTIYGKLEDGSRARVDAGFKAVMGPRTDNHSDVGIVIERLSSTAARPNVTVTFDNVHFANFEIREFDAKNEAHYVSYVVLRCVVHGYYLEEKIGFFENVIHGLPNLPEEVREEINGQGGAGIGAEEVLTSDIVLDVVDEDFTAMSTYIVARTYRTNTDDEYITTGEDIGMVLMASKNNSTQALDIKIRGTVAFKNEDYPKEIFKTPPSVRSVTFTGKYTRTPGGIVEKPKLVFPRGYKCKFPEKTFLIFRDLALDVCGESEEWMFSTDRKKYQLVLENVELRVCRQNDHGDLINPLVLVDGKSSSRSCCPQQLETLAAATACSTMCKNVCFENGTLIDYGACFRNVTTTFFRTGHSHRILVWIYSLATAGLVAIVIAGYYIRDRVAVRHCEQITLDDGSYAKIYPRIIKEKSKVIVYEAKYFSKTQGELEAVAKSISSEGDNAEEEAEISVSLGRQKNHSNIVKCYGSGKSNAPHNNFYIVYERLGQTLTDLILEDKDFFRSCTYKGLIQIFQGIASGISYMHNEMDMIHFDIKPSNVVMGREGIPKIIDFGHVKRNRDGSVSISEQRGTEGYMSPEMQKQSSPRVTKAVDIYSFGVLMWECIMRRRLSTPPSLPKTASQKIEIYTDGRIEQIDCLCPEALRVLVQNCVRYDCAERHNRGAQGQPSTQTYGRPAIDTVKETLEELCEEVCMRTKPLAWRRPLCEV